MTNKVKIVNQKEHFLSDKQKEVKEKIMHELLDAFFLNLFSNKELFSKSQEASDLFFSILVMFNRELLANLCLSLQVPLDQRNEMLDTLFSEIKKEVNNRVKKGMN